MTVLESIDKIKNIIFYHPGFGIVVMITGIIYLGITEFVSTPELVTVAIKVISVLGMFQIMFSMLSINTGTHIRRD